MSGVEQQLAPVRELPDVEASRPLRVCEASSDGRARNGQPARVRHAQQPHGDRGVGPLVRPTQADGQIADVPGVCLDHRRTDAAGDVIDRRSCLRMELTDHDRHAGFEDAGFLTGDLLQRVPQKPLVIEIDRGNGRRHRAHDVGRVEPPAEADLEHGDVDRRAAEQFERRGGGHLEERRLNLKRALGSQPFDRVADLRDDRRQLAAVDGPAVNRKPFGEVDQVRGGVAGGAMTGGPQRRVDHGDDGTLPVRAGDVNRPEGPLGMAEPRHECRDIFQPELDPEAFEAEEVGEGIHSLYVDCPIAI